MTDSTDGRSYFKFVTYPDNATYTRTPPGLARCPKGYNGGKHTWYTYFQGDGYVTYKCAFCGATKQEHIVGDC